MNLPIHQVDAFADAPFAGNPAGVCILTEPRDDRWMQNVAREMNLSETAFLTEEANGFRLRWFTPVVEVDLCGHATLASAHVLWETAVLDADQEARFFTRSGTLLAQRKGRTIELDFPALSLERIAAPDGLEAALGVEALHVARCDSYCLVEVDSERTVRAAAPDFGRLKRIPVDAIIITASGSQGIDFVSRVFAPNVGIDEDPVTGSAHCCLGPFWSERLKRAELRGFQASPRGGHLGVHVLGDRVLIGGEAVTVLRGELLGV